jgi:hypothetical protein
MPNFEYGIRDLGLTKKQRHPWNDYNFKGDKRLKEWHKQHSKYGFDEREMWNLDITFALYIYPRLKFFRDNIVGKVFVDENDLAGKIDKMLWSFAEVN